MAAAEATSATTAAAETLRTSTSTRVLEKERKKGGGKKRSLQHALLLPSNSTLSEIALYICVSSVEQRAPPLFELSHKLISQQPET